MLKAGLSVMCGLVEGEGVWSSDSSTSEHSATGEIGWRFVYFRCRRKREMAAVATKMTRAQPVISPITIDLVVEFVRVLSGLVRKTTDTKGPRPAELYAATLTK